MRIEHLHDWNVSTTEARAIQESLAGAVNVSVPLPPWQTIAAADVSFSKFATHLYAAIVVARAETFEVVERIGVVAEVTFPYVPGLFTFREAPPILAAFEKLTVIPDVVLCDGQGIAHPRRIGLASHLGLWLGLPTIGAAKSRLCGEYVEPGPNRGERSPLIDDGAVIGAVVRTRARVKPMFVSPGHLCDLEGAVAVVLATAVKYRMPVPSRLAHVFCNDIRRAAESGAPIPR